MTAPRALLALALLLPALPARAQETNLLQQGGFDDGYTGRGRGDLFVSVTVVTPTSLTREQRRLLEQLAEIEDRDFENESLMDKVRSIFS